MFAAKPTYAVFLESLTPTGSLNHSEALSLEKAEFGNQDKDSIRSLVKQTLLECGEMDRWDREVFPSAIEDVKQTIVRTLRTPPPSDGHCKRSRIFALLDKE